MKRHDQAGKPSDSQMKPIPPGMRQIYYLVYLGIVLGFLWYHPVIAHAPIDGNPNSDPHKLNGVPTAPGIDYVEIIEDQLGGKDIFVDNFEDGKSLGSKYADYNSGNGNFVVTNSMGFGGSAHSVMATWTAGQVDAGSFAYMFGRNPVASLSNSGVDFREIYWRLYIKTSAGWQGNPRKLTRATILANKSWAQAMIGHIWGDPSDLMLTLDPASGIDASGNLVTTKYNDFNNLKWLGKRTGTTPVYDLAHSGTWQCVEIHIKLNSPGKSDGIFEFWVNNHLEASRKDLNWVGSWTDYGINTVMFGNYWNGGAPRSQTRYMDNIVISQTRIGLAKSPRNPVVALTPFVSDAGRVQQGMEYQVSTTPDSSTIVFSGASAGSQNQFQINTSYGTFRGALSGSSSLTPGTEYYVRARYVDDLGSFSDWSTWKIFKTEVTGSTSLPAVPNGMRIDSK